MNPYSNAQTTFKSKYHIHISALLIKIKTPPKRENLIMSNSHNCSVQ